ncbi:hypothetical protein Q3C01_33605 [Bradyrhizobium sp. UFLA05-109]
MTERVRSGADFGAAGNLDFVTAGLVGLTDRVPSRQRRNVGSRLWLPIMSAVTNLLARRQLLLRQLESGLSEVSRQDVERQLEQIDTALELLEWLAKSRDHNKS